MAVNNPECVSFCFSASISEGQVLQKWNSGSRGKSICKFGKHLQVTLHRDSTNLNSHEQCPREPVWPTQCHLVIGCFFQSYAWKPVSQCNTDLCVLWGWASFQIFWPKCDLLNYYNALFFSLKFSFFDWVPSPFSLLGETLWRNYAIYASFSEFLLKTD